MESKHWHLPALSSGKSRGNLGSDLRGGERRREEKEERRGGREEGKNNG